MEEKPRTEIHTLYEQIKHIGKCFLFIFTTITVITIIWYP